MPTPRLAKKVIKRARKQTSIYYAKLIDGVHPNENSSKDWIKQISMAMLESGGRRPELFRRGHYFGNNSQNISKPEHPQPVKSPCPTLPTIIDTDSDDDKQLMRRQWRTYSIDHNEVSQPSDLGGFCLLGGVSTPSVMGIPPGRGHLKALLSWLGWA